MIDNHYSQNCTDINEWYRDQAVRAYHFVWEFTKLEGLAKNSTVPIDSSMRDAFLIHFTELITFVTTGTSSKIFYRNEAIRMVDDEERIKGEVTVLYNDEGIYGDAAFKNITSESFIASTVNKELTIEEKLAASKAANAALKAAAKAHKEAAQNTRPVSSLKTENDINLITTNTEDKTMTTLNNGSATPATSASVNVYDNEFVSYDDDYSYESDYSFMSDENDDVNAALNGVDNINNGPTLSPKTEVNVNNRPESSLKTDEAVNITTEVIPMTTNTNVSKIINFGAIAEAAVNFNGQGVSLAEVFAGIIYKGTTATHFTKDTDEQKAKELARVERINAEAAANRAKFVAKFEGRLGSIIPVVLDYNQSDYNRVSMALRLNLESLVTISLVTASGKVVIKGLSEVVEAPRFDMEKVNSSVVMFSVLAKATANLTATERAELISMLFGFVPQGTVVTAHGISIDLAAGTINTGSRSLSVNKASCFGVIGDDFIVLDGAQSLFMFALQAFGGTEKQAQTAVNLAIKLFAPEHNYGHKPDSDDISFHVRANLIYTNSVSQSNTKFPSFSIKGGNQHPNFLAYVLNKGVIATSDKTNIKFVTIGEGAEATGIGWNRELNVMMTVNDVNKPSKLINRGAANNYDCADQPNRVASNFGFQLSNGEVVHTKGRMMKVAYTNSVLLTAGSGTGTIHPSVFFDYTVDKNLKFPFQFSLLGAEYVNDVVRQDNFIKQFFAALETKKGQVFAPGATIMSINGMNIVANTEVCSSVEFISVSVKRNVLDNNELEINTHVRLQGHSQFVKTRRFATKFTTTPYNVQGLSQEWEIILNNECTKGQGALLEMFANETGVRYVNNNTGEFVSTTGDVINLLNEDNAFQTWKETSTVKEVITVTIAKSVYNNIKEFAPSELVVIAETATTVTVQETVSVIFGSLVFDVEISTPLESVSTSSMTLESASAVYLQSAKLGGVFLNQVANQTKAFNALAQRFANITDNMEVVDVKDEESYTEFLSRVSEVDTQSADQKAMFSALAKLYPSGINFICGVSKFKICFDIARSFGQWNSLNNSAARENAQICNFIVDVMDNGAVNASVLILKAARAFKKILDTAVNSKNVLKKPTRAGRLVYGKVRTGLHPILNSVDGVPSVVINANCPMVNLLGVKNGDFVGFARTPMPFLGAGRVVLTTDAGICDIAHVLLDPYVFHALCEGKLLPL
jgi:hypothetical protein